MRAMSGTSKAKYTLAFLTLRDVRIEVLVTNVNVALSDYVSLDDHVAFYCT